MPESDKRSKSESIDASANTAVESIAGARGASRLGSKRRLLPLGSKTFLSVILICALSICGVLIWKVWKISQGGQNGSNSDNRPVSNNLPSLALPSPKTIEISPKLEKEAQDEIYSPEADASISSEMTALQRRLSSGLIGRYTSINTAAGRSNTQEFRDNLEQDGFRDSDGELQSKLKPLRLNPSAAGLLSDRDYLLTQGAMIDCQLETRLVTTQPGMTSCYTTRNVYSSNGRVVLIDRGSKVVGHYQGGIVQGQASIFVLWTRLETPKGVIINLDSPGSGFLGESGLDGYIDTHFWQRFGGAIMMSLIGDFGEYAAKRGKQHKGNTIQFNNTTAGMQDAVVEALKNSINIPPTLYKNQGERISIFVARDLDFGGIYGLEYTSK